MNNIQQIENFLHFMLDFYLSIVWSISSKKEPKKYTAKAFFLQRLKVIHVIFTILFQLELINFTRAMLAIQLQLCTFRVLQIHSFLQLNAVPYRMPNSSRHQLLHAAWIASASSLHYRSPPDGANNSNHTSNILANPVFHISKDTS